MTPSRPPRTPLSSSTKRKAKGASAIDPLTATVAAVTLAAARIMAGQALLAWMDAAPRFWGRSGERSGLLAEPNQRNEEYWRKLSPAVNLATVAEVQWEAAVGVGDHVAATVAGIVVAAAEEAKKAAHDASLRAQRVWDEVAWATEGIARPLAEALPAAPASAHRRVGDPGCETKEQALDRFVSEVEAEDLETLAPLAGLLRRYTGQSVGERLERIRGCSLWSDSTGILANHPPEACVILFRKLLVSPPVYMGVKNDLTRTAILRRDAINFREKVDAHEKGPRDGEDAGLACAPACRMLPGLTLDESERFRSLLDLMCAGGDRRRHGKEGSERISTIRLIAEHFRAVLGLSQSDAADLFRAEPWKSDIAELAHVALYYEVTAEDVRGALKNWISD